MTEFIVTIEDLEITDYDFGVKIVIWQLTAVKMTVILQIVPYMVNNEQPEKIFQVAHYNVKIKIRLLSAVKITVNF